MKNILKICLIAVLTLSLLFCIVACTGNGDNGDGTGTSGDGTGTTGTTGTTAADDNGADGTTSGDDVTESTETEATFGYATDDDSWQGFIPF